MSSPLVSVVVPTVDGWHLLCACLASLRAQVFTGFETIVVDNGSKDETLERLRHDYPEVRLIGFAENRGFCEAVNAGILAARGKYVALLNNDAVPDPDWLDALVSALDRRLDADFCASKMLILGREGIIDTVGDGFTVAGFGYKRGWMQKDNGSFDVEEEVFGACAGAAIYRREAFDEVGLFDSDFFAFAEDLDWSFRARLLGKRCVFVPRAKVYHRARATANLNSRLALYHHYRNSVAVIVKNMPTRLLLRYAPHILVHSLGTLLTNCFRGLGYVHLKALWRAAFSLPATLRKRRAIQATRRASNDEILRLLDRDWFQVLMRLRTT